MTQVADSSDKVFATQSVFRAVMNAMSRPGSVHQVVFPDPAPAPMMLATAAIAASLFDQDTPIWLDQAMAASEVVDWLRFHTGAPVIDKPSQSHFALIGDARAVPLFDQFAQGTGDYPDRSTTIVMQLKSLTHGPAAALRGPGIDGVSTLNAMLEPADLIARLDKNANLFPLGVDLILVAGTSIVALPRTTRLTATGG